MDRPDTPSIRDHLERVMPPGGRARRVIGWGVVAWTAIGAAIVLWVLGKVLARMAGILPYLVVAGMVVLILNPAVRRLARAGVPRRLAATLVFLLFVGVVVLLV